MSMTCISTVGYIAAPETNSYIEIHGYFLGPFIRLVILLQVFTSQINPFYFVWCNWYISTAAVEKNASFIACVQYNT